MRNVHLINWMVLLQTTVLELRSFKELQERNKENNAVAITDFLKHQGFISNEERSRTFTPQDKPSRIQSISNHTFPCRLFGEVSNMNGHQALQSSTNELRTTPRSWKNAVGQSQGSCTKNFRNQTGRIRVRMTHISSDLRVFYL